MSGWWQISFNCYSLVLHHNLGVPTIKPKTRIQPSESLAYALSHIFLEDRKIRTYQITESNNNFMVAEPKVAYGQTDK